MRKYCALGYIWSLQSLNAADQKVTPPPPVTIGRRAAAADGKRTIAAAEAYRVGADAYRPTICQ